MPESKPAVHGAGVTVPGAGKEPAHDPLAFDGADKAKAHDPEPAKEPASFPAECSALSAKLDAAGADPAKIEACWKDLDALSAKLSDKSTAADRQHLTALSARFHHVAPRKLSGVNAIEAALDAGLANKEKPAKAKVEHPAVTKAKADLALLQADHANRVSLPEDERAVAALEAKIAAAPLVDAD